MKAILFVVILLKGSPVDTLAQPFKSLAECEAYKLQAAQMIAANANITQYVMVCGEVVEKV